MQEMSSQLENVSLFDFRQRMSLSMELTRRLLSIPERLREFCREMEQFDGSAVKNIEEAVTAGLLTFKDEEVMEISRALAQSKDLDESV